MAHRSCETWLGVVLLAAALAATVPARGNAQLSDWAVSPGLRLEQRYDDNILFTDSDRLSDFISRLTGTIRIAGQGERTRLQFTSDLIGELYADHSDLDVFNNATRLAVDQAWSERFKTSFGLGFVKDETLESELEAAGTTAVRSPRYRYSGSLGGDYLLTERTGLKLEASGSRTEYPDHEYPDHNSIVTTLTPYRLLTPLDTLGINLYGSLDDYSDSSTIETLGLWAGWSRELSPTHHFELGAGYRFSRTSVKRGSLVPVLDPATGVITFKRVSADETSSNGGLILNLALTKDWTERFSTVLAAGVRQYSTVDAASVQNEFVRGNLNFRLSERATLGLGLGFDLNRHDSDRAGLDDSGDSSDTRYLSSTPSLRYQLGQDLYLDAALNYQVRMDMDQDSDTDRLRAWIGLTADWPRLWANH